MYVKLFQYNHFGDIRKFFQNEDGDFFYCDHDILGKKMRGSSKAEFLGSFYVFIDDKINYFNSYEELENYENKDIIEIENKNKEYELFISKKDKMIYELEKQLNVLKNISCVTELENYEKIYSKESLIEINKQKKKVEKIEECKKEITLYFKNNSLDNFKLKNMLYDLKINNKTFYNYKLDEFIKQFLEKK